MGKWISNQPAVGLWAKRARFHNGGMCSKQGKWEKVGHSMGDLIIKAFRLRKEKIIERMLDVGVRGYQATEL